eukprot:gnl/MRDRNA2_/MRDRNA2_121848_c0_seq1.p1 gnl/MRDRNA2_/MRDRNA2_121848_c0~~gnl/MRDRNA2_/MRDRNA2_121848_c0_seq1.p1  ORF type:complete len:663 (-),score=170.07 gnl/MRDRNA2_/MRDRNA2_121848_c0_seq1:99-2087(-)
MGGPKGAGKTIGKKGAHQRETNQEEDAEVLNSEWTFTSPKGGYKGPAGKGSGEKDAAETGPEVVHDEGDDSDDEDEDEEGSEQGNEFIGDDDPLSEEEGGAAKSLFGLETFPSAKACWTHMEAQHSFSIEEIKSRFGKSWTPYHQPILVNYLRSLGPEAARLAAPKIDRDSEFWKDEKFLIPVLGDDDALLFEGFGDAEEWSDDDDDLSGQAFYADRVVADMEKQVGTTATSSTAQALPSKDSACVSGVDGSQQEIADLRAENAHLRKTLADTQRLLCEADEPGTVGKGKGAVSKSITVQHFATAECEEVHRQLALDKARIEAYERFIKGNSGLFKDRIVLDVACGSGIFSCLSAQAGARRVVGVEPSLGTAELARRIAKANFLSEQVLFVEGRIEDVEIGCDSEGSILDVPARGGRGGSGKGSTEQESSEFFCDVIIAEWMGSALIHSPNIDSVLWARRKYLRPGGLIMPGRAKLMLGTADLRDQNQQTQWQNAMYGLNLQVLAPQFSAEARVQLLPAGCMTSKNPAELLHLNLNTTDEIDTSLECAKFRVELEPHGTTNALVLYFDAFFDSADSPVTLSTSPEAPPTRWKQVVLPLLDPMCSGKLQQLCLPGADIEAIVGTFSCGRGLDNDQHLDMAVQLQAVQRDGGNGPLVNATYTLR